MIRKTPKFVRILLVIALLAGILGSLVPVATPVAADVSSAIVVVSPANAGQVASYTITFATSTGQLVEDVSTITVTFPTGTTLPSSIPNGGYSVNSVSGASVGSNTTAPIGPLVSGQSVTVTVPSTTSSASTTLVFTQAAGIKNPPLSQENTTSNAAYTLSVATSNETTAVVSAAYAINDFVVVAATSAKQSGKILATGGGFLPGTSMSLGPSNVMSGSGTVDDDGTFSINGSRGKNAAAAITATDGSGRMATGPSIALLASLSADIKAPKRGEVVTITGKNFTVGGQLSLTTTTVKAVTSSATSTVTNYNSMTLGGSYLPTADIAASTPTSIGINFVDTDADNTSDDFVIKVTVPSNAGSGFKVLSITESSSASTPKSGTVTLDIQKSTAAVSPRAGPPGTVVTISVGGVPPSNTNAANRVLILTLNQAYLSAQLTGNITTDTGGNATVSNVVIPATAPPGVLLLLVQITGSDGLVASATGIFFATAAATTATVSPSTGPRGTTVVLTATGLSASATVATNSVTIGGANWNTGSSGQAGSFAVDSGGNSAAATLIVLSSAAYGSNAVVITDNNNVIANTSFSVTQPTIQVDKTSGNVGDSVIVTGTGWLSNQVVNLLRNTSVATTATADASGNFVASLPVPSTLFSSGNKTTFTISANDGSTNGNVSGVSVFTISRAIVGLSPTTAAVGSQVTITATGFLPQTGVVTLTIGGVSVAPTTPAITNTVGSVSLNFVVPGLTGAQTVSVTIGNVTRTAPLTVTATTAVAGAIAIGTALTSVEATGSLELVTSFNYTTGLSEAYVPNLGGNALLTIVPHSVLVITTTADMTIQVSGVNFAIKANTPTPIPVGGTVTIEVQ